MVTKTSDLIPLNASRGRLIPQSPDGKLLNCSTLWRWHRKGLAGLNGERIRLRVVYIGRTPHVSAEMVEEFFAQVTAAKLERIRQQELASADVTDDELAAAGLVLHRGGCNRQTTRPPQSLTSSDSCCDANGVDADPIVSGDSNSGSCSQTSEHPKRGQIGRGQ